MKIVTIVGTRPEIIKMSLTIRELDKMERESVAPKSGLN